MHGCSRRAIRTLVVLGSCALDAAPAAAQLPFELGLGVGRNGSPPAELSDDGCAADISWAAEARPGLRLSRAVRLDGVLGYTWAPRRRCSDPLPPPTDGERTLRSVPEAGYPVWTGDVRLSIEPATPTGPIWFRVFGGYGRMLGKGIPYWVSGAGIVVGTNVETVIDFEWMWFDVPFEDDVQTFSGGALLSESTVLGEISRREFRIKAGFRFPL